MALVAATRELLKAEPVASGRVFYPDIPESEHVHMPRQCVLVRGSGGGVAAAHRMKTASQRIDVKSYGVTSYGASRLDDEVSAALQAFRQKLVTVPDPAGAITVKVGWFSQTGGPNELVDPDTEWPFTLSVWEVWGDRYAGGT